MKKGIVVYTCLHRDKIWKPNMRFLILGTLWGLILGTATLTHSRNNFEVRTSVIVERNTSVYNLFYAYHMIIRIFE